jgi:APA family basic amino acid/polyamine antiporter
MSPSPTPGGRRELPRVIGFVQATALVIGTIIGTSIFVQPSEITRSVPTVSGILVAWALAGTLTILFALTCAELASAFPATGGVYVFLREAYSRRLAFLWGWSSVWIIHTGVIAAIAMVCARYLAYFVPAATDHERLVAVGVVLAVSAVNYVGVRIGAVLLTLSTAAKLAAIAVLLMAGLAVATPGAVTTWHPGPTELRTVPLGQLLLGVGAGLFAFGGAHAVTYVAGETTDPSRTVPRALTIGTLVVTLCYIALNALYLYVLPLDTVRTSPRVAAEVAAVLIGPVGGSAVAALVVLSGVGTITGIALAGPRMYLSMAADGMAPAWLDAVHPRVALVSVGAGNRYGHPADHVLQSLDERGVHLLRTDDDAVLREVTDVFGVTFMVTTGDSGDVEVSHSGAMYVVDETGKLVLTWPFGVTADDVAADLEVILGEIDDGADA